jgi:polysaccharide export outer membrane protein
MIFLFITFCKELYYEFFCYAGSMLAVILNFKRNLAMLLLPFMVGCVVVPGSHISSGFGQSNETSAVKINTLEITPSLIADMNAKSTNNNLLRYHDPKIDDNDYSYRVGVGDVLNITVWDHPELTIPAGQFRSAGETGNVVHPDGTIFYPYVGKIRVEGLHVTEIRELIARDLSRYIEAPQLDISIAAFRSQRVFISGAVVKPSTLPITNVPLTLMDAITACGGMSADADWRSVVLTSTDNQGRTTKEVLNLYALLQNGDISQNRVLVANDIIHVPRNDGLKVFVMGDVVKAETQRMDRSGLTLAEALNNVGGINEGSANARGIFVLRASDEADRHVDVYQLNAKVGSMLILTTQFQLQPMDIVYVTSAPFARWNKVISQLVPSVSSLYQLDRMSKD